MPKNGHWLLPILFRFLTVRILFLTNRIPWPLNDGGNIATFKVAEGLSNKGHEVHFASLNTQKHFVEKKDLPEKFTWHTVDINTDLSPIGLLSGLLSSFPYNVKRFRSEEFSDMLESLLKKTEYDVIQVEGIYMGMYADEMRVHSKAPIILRSHNIEHRIWERQKENESFAKSAYLSNLVPKIRAFELETFQKFDGIIPITTEDEKWYVEHDYDGLIQTIPAGVDDVVSRQSEISEGDAVAFIGSLEWLPNLEGVRWFLEEIWPHVIPAKPHAFFHLAGKNAPQEIDSWKFPGLEFHGMVPDSGEFVSSYPVFVVPLTSGSGMRLKILEAMSHGVAVVSTSIGAEGIPVTHGENVLIADEPKEFAEAILYLWNHEEEAVEMGRKAREFVLKNFHFDTLTDKFVSFYEKLIVK